MYKSAKWQQYKYAVAAIIVIIVFCGFLFSYVVVAISASAPATKALNNIAISNSFQHQPNSPNTVGISWSIGNYSIELGQDFNITNTGDQNLTLTLMFSAALTAIGAEKTDYNLGSIAMPNVTLTSHSSRVISANLNSTVPDLNLTEEGGGYFGYSFSVDASIATTYLFWHPTVGYKTFDFNGSIVF